MNEPRRDFSSFFSPEKTNTSLQRHGDHNNNDDPSTPVSSRPNTAPLESLLSAIESEDADSFTKLLATCNNNVDVNQIVPGRDMSLLHYSVGCSENNTQIVEALLRLGGDPNNVNISEKYSPLHISAFYDFEKVMKILIEYGGDPKIASGDGETCFDMVRHNLDELLDNCLNYLFKRFSELRKSRQHLYDSGSDRFYSCESENFSQATSNFYAQNELIHSFVRKFCPDEYSNFMTEDETAEASSDDEDDNAKKKMTTAPIYVITDDSTRDISNSGLSFVNYTPPIMPQPTRQDLEKLQEQMKQLNIPVTFSTYGVMSMVSKSDSKLQALLAPRTRVQNYSPELQAGIQDINLIYEWANIKVDLLQHATPTALTRKTFYNYLLLDPRIIKRANFSGDHLKTNVAADSEEFQNFLESIFYIGKGKGNRPLQHLYEANKYSEDMSRKSLQYGVKIGKILEIRRSGLEVIIVNMFAHSSEKKANLNEACMIDAMGLVELSNIKRGSYKGTVAENWSRKRKNQFGSALLFNSFRTFAATYYQSNFTHRIFERAKKKTPHCGRLLDF